MTLGRELWRRESLTVAERDLWEGLGVSGVEQVSRLDGPILNRDSRSIVRRVDSAGEQPALYVKTFRYAGVLEWLRRLGRPSHCRREYDNFERLRSLGVGCPQAVAAGEVRILGAPRASFLVTREIDESVELLSFLRDGSTGAADRRRLVDTLAGQVARLHRGGYLDRDMKFRNILVREHAGMIEVFHVDSTQGRVARTRRSLARGVVHDLATLDKYAHRYFTVRERLRFLVRYAAQVGLAPERRPALAVAVAARTRRLRRRSVRSIARRRLLARRPAGGRSRRR